MPTLLSIQTGRPKTYGKAHAADPHDRTWRTAIFKEPVLGEVWLGEESLDGDAVENRDVHGGPDNAVLCYAAEHYSLWQKEWGTDEALPYGGFGENFTISGLDEQTVCVGDVYAIGDVRIEVSGARAPCSKLERRWRRFDLIKRVLETGRSGWYARVLQTGFVRSGVEVDLLDRPQPSWNIARVLRVSSSRQSSREAREEAIELLSVPKLAARPRRWLRQRIAPSSSAAHL
ncbi:MAG: MOSC domain-containing protein [Acidobacteriaceae bacterium]